MLVNLDQGDYLLYSISSSHCRTLSHSASRRWDLHITDRKDDLRMTSITPFTSRPTQKLNLRPGESRSTERFSIRRLGRRHLVRSLSTEERGAQDTDADGGPEWSCVPPEHSTLLIYANRRRNQQTLGRSSPEREEKWRKWQETTTYVPNVSASYHFWILWHINTSLVVQVWQIALICLF
jgi:hypothetical protein